MTDFWTGSGHHLLDRDAEGRLLVSDTFLKAYLARPELLPPEDACETEHRLHHELLMHDPRRPVSPEEIAAIADADARENWTFMVAFRDRLLAAGSLEAAYLHLVRQPGGTPPLFLNQLAQVILRNALDRETNPFVLRAAELFFRPQKVSSHEGRVLLADAETIEVHEQNRHASPLLAMLGGPAVTELDILDEANSAAYFERSDRFDMVLNFGLAEARSGLARAMETWIGHLIGIETTIEPVTRVEDPDWAWFIGLDAEATRIGNALWTEGNLDDERGSRIVALFRLEFRERSLILPQVGSRPVWLILAVDGASTVRMKPQNLIAGLPLQAHATRN